LSKSSALDKFYCVNAENSNNHSIIYLEAVTELSDLESRVRSLRQQLRNKKAEAEKLWKEQQRKKKEQLRMKEQSLLKQIQVRSNLLSCTDYKTQTCQTV
jgi:predicted nuclease with TOPRIM domain